MKTPQGRKPPFTFLLKNSISRFLPDITEVLLNGSWYTCKAQLPYSG